MGNPVGQAYFVKTNIYNVHSVHTLAFNDGNLQDNAPYAFGRQGLLADSMGKSLQRVLFRLERCFRAFGCQRRGANTCMRTSSNRNESSSKMADERAR